MTVTYLFSSPEGDIPLSPEILRKPFLLKPSVPHSFLTLKDYFDAIRHFVLKDCSKALSRVLKGPPEERTGRDDLREVRIRSEKHGSLYHLASVEIFDRDKPVKLTVSSAVSQEGKGCLAREYETLKGLHDALDLPYLPRVYAKGEIECPVGGKKTETFVMMSGEWFEDYHEWHITRDRENQRQRVLIWDLKDGHRYASEGEACEILRQASRILTLYHDPETFKQIYPWHHAAGDFVVKTGEDGIHVRLTTARDYRSIMDLFSKEAVHPMIAWVYFFLNLTLKMRLDRLDGVGETVWVEDYAIGAATAGFFEGLSAMKKAGRLQYGMENEILALFQTISEAEFERIFRSFHLLYEGGDPAEIPLLQANLKNHIRILVQALRAIRL